MNELAAPSLSSGVPTSFDLTDGSEWIYSYPSVVDGTLSPFEATVSISDELQPFVTTEITNSAVKLTYDG